MKTFIKYKTYDKERNGIHKRLGFNIKEALLDIGIEDPNIYSLCMRPQLS